MFIYMFPAKELTALPADTAALSFKLNTALGTFPGNYFLTVFHIALNF